MNPILRHYLRVDARSLGLFRILMGLVLLGDLARRFRFVKDFYSNDGLLPNHNHLFNLRGGGSVWSALHAVSTDGEAVFAFAVIALVYVMFMIGWRTRVFHAISFVAMLSLTARNLLLEGPGNHLALALLLITLPLPLGSRFSLDALVSTMRRARESSPAAIRGHRVLPSETVDDWRLAGWSPLSLGALGVLVQMVLVHIALYLQHGGPTWKDGTAIGRGLEIALLASERGFALRGSALLGPLTHFAHYAPALAAVLLLVPVARGVTRGLAAVLIALHGLVWALLFNFGLFGWSLVASAALVLSSEVWDSAARHHPARARTVVFDADCGICGWLAKLLVRLDPARHITVQGNDELDQLMVRKGKNGPVEEVDLPKGLDAELADRTVVAVRPDGSFAIEAQAISEIMRALPGFRWLGFIIAAPGIASLMGVLYRFVAQRRHRISALVGLGACGVPVAKGKPQPTRDEDEPSPFDRTVRKLTGSVRELVALVVVASAVVQTARANEIGLKLPEVKPLASVAHWTRTQAEWKLLSPDPPGESGLIVSDAVLRNDANVDLFTRVEPHFGLDRPFRMGELWSSYFRRIHQDAYEPYVAAFRTYISKGGPMSELEDVNQRPLGADVYWIWAPASGGEVERKRLLRHGRGGPNSEDFGTSQERPQFTPQSRMMRNR